MKIVAIAAVTLVVSLFGCAGEEPEVESTTVVESTTTVPVTPEPVATETETAGSVAVEPATENDATTAGEPADDDAGMPMPKNHTVDHDGVMHAPDSEKAATKCTACHGKDLRGGKAGVSCYDCHDQNWS